MDKPRVKPLEWEDYPADDGSVMSKAVALHGTYFIVDDTDDFSGLYLQLISHDNAQWWQHVRSTCDTLLEGIHDDDLEPIKAAAQADYESRILAALEPVTVQEAAQVLLGDDFTSPMLEALDPYNNDADVWNDVKAALAELKGKD